MKTLVAFSTVLMLLTAVPATAMSCCGGGKGKGAAMCGRGDMAMKHGAMKHGAMKHGAMKHAEHGSRKSGKTSCCCEGMTGKMSKRV